MATTYVSTFAELKNAIEDTTSTEIIATSNITFASGGARVNITKSTLVIDFGGFTVIDNNSSGVGDTIYVPSTTNTIYVTVKNAIWSGRNYYGVIGVYDGNTNTTISFENIDYTGPQFVYNKYGSTIISNSKILLDRNGSSSNPQEFCEANRLTISGNVVVNSNTTGNAVIWFTNANAALTVEENANFEVNALSTYFLYTDVSPVMLFKANSNTKITTKTGLFYSTGASSHIASSFTLKENASFIAYKTTANSVPMFKCVSNLTISENSTFQLYSESSGSAALLYFGQVANINISSPRNIVFYNNGGNVFSFQTGSSATPNTMTISTEMMRLWDSSTTPLSSAGGFSDTPTTQYHKNNFSSDLKATIKMTNSQIVSVENNLTDADSGFPMTAATLKLLTSKTISMGTLKLNVNDVTDISSSITGTANTNANISATYDATTITGTANESGIFSISIPNKIAVGTTIAISTNKQFLTKNMTVTSIGSVSVTSAPKLKFVAFASPAHQKTVHRQDTNWSIQVSDTRTSGDKWYLYAHITKPLTSQSNTLDNALIFKDNDTQTTLSSTPTLVYVGQWNQAEKTTIITWQKEEGFLLNIDKDKNYNSGDYSTNILWQITTEPI